MSLTRYELVTFAAEDFIANMQVDHPETKDLNTIRCPLVKQLATLVLTTPRPRDVAFDALSSERDYQDRVWRENAGLESNCPVRTVAEELLMLEEYVAKARAAWTAAPRNTEVAVTTDILRKCGGIILRALENHGAPRRG